MKVLVILFLTSVNNILKAPEAAEDVIAAMRRASCATEGQEVILPVHVWRASGSHELFASLGFDLMEVGQSEVTLRTGKQASRRAVQFALQALLALFGKLKFILACIIMVEKLHRNVIYDIYTYKIYQIFFTTV